MLQLHPLGRVGGVVDGRLERAIHAVRAALNGSEDPVGLRLLLPRGTAEKVLTLLEAEGAAGAVVVPVKEQFTTTEAARMLGISRPTLMKLIESGEIGSVKVATHHRIPAPAIARYESARTAGRLRAAEALEDLAGAAKDDFRNNVTFGGESQ